MKRVLGLAAWYVSVGVAVGIETGLHQAQRFDPGFDPVFAAVVTACIWPVVLVNDLSLFIAHLNGTLPPTH